MTTTQLDFWVENAKLYATLGHMAQYILIIPASSRLSMVEEPIGRYKLRE